MIDFINKLFGKKIAEKTAENELGIEFYIPRFEWKKCDLSIEERTWLALKGISIGDIIGSKYEGLLLCETPDRIDLLGEGHEPTDDTIMSIATLEATNTARHNAGGEMGVYAETYRIFGRWYPDAGYGVHFKEWIEDETKGPYESCGNGAAMRAGIIGAMFDCLNDVIYYARLSALPSHNHPEGIKGAIVTAVCTWMAFHGATKECISEYIKRMYSKTEYADYKISGETTWDELMALDEKLQTLSLVCQTSVPEAFLNLQHSDDYESCMRNNMRYLCDRDTLGAISGGAAAGIYRVIEVEGKTADDIIREYVPKELWRYFGLDPEYL